MSAYPPLWPPEIEAKVRAAARNLDEQTPPPDIKFCARCVVSNQRPRITFDEEGICSACRYAEQKAAIDWDDRRRQLAELLDKHRGGRTFDCIVPCSGGKDSAMVAHRLKTEFGMRPLLARFAPAMATDVGERNWQSLLHRGFEGRTAQPDGLVHRKLSRLCFEFLGDPFQPFVYGQLGWPMLLAWSMHILLVVWGENGEREYGGDTSAPIGGFWDHREWERVYAKGQGIRRMVALGKDLGALSDAEAALHHLSPTYVVPRHTWSDQQNIWFGDFTRWHPQWNFYTAAEHCGFETNGERSEGTYSMYASLDDRLDGLHYYMSWIKFGLGRATSDAAHEIRDGDITRDEAVSLVRQFDGEFPRKHLYECLSYLGLDADHLHRIIDRFRPPHLWRREPLGATEYWKLRHTVFDEEAKEPDARDAADDAHETAA